MVNFKEDTWFYALIAAIIALISLLTPWGSIDVLGTDVYSWLGGTVSYWGNPADAWDGNGLGLWTLGVTMMSIGILLVISINAMRGGGLKLDWLIYAVTGILMLILTILTLTFEGTEGAVIGFAPIGLIIASIFAISAFAVDKFVK
ncbi:MAG: hypothetical protein ACFFCE_12570 [Promethearchaeota archaeon]